LNAIAIFLNLEGNVASGVMATLLFAFVERRCVTHIGEVARVDALNEGDVREFCFNVTRFVRKRRSTSTCT